jgi:hypothetical protein
MTVKIALLQMKFDVHTLKFTQLAKQMDHQTHP